VSDQTYLFADHTLTMQAYAMRRVAEIPKTISDEPVLENANPYGSILRDPKTGLYRAWYLGKSPYTEYYATSEDGVTWDLPDLGVLPEDEYGRRNAFLGPGQYDAKGHWLAGDTGPEGFCVLDSEMEGHPCAKARFTAMYLCGVKNIPGGLCIAHSDDGITWFADDYNPVITGWLDTNNSILWDSDIQRYVVYGRSPVRATAGTEPNRFVSRMESSDLINWESPRTVFHTDDRDADPWDMVDEGSLRGSKEPLFRGRNRQFYGLSAFKSAGMYLGLLQMYDVPTGRAWLELVHSVDGKEWQRDPHRTLYMNTRPDSWESEMILPAAASAPIAVDDEIRIYYGGYNTTHHDSESGRMGMSYRTIGRDRWIGYHSSDREAELLTMPMKVGSWMTLNASTGKDGWIRVELISDWGKEIEGYTLNDATVISGSSFAHEVRWGDRVQLPEGDDIRLRIRSCNASMWSVNSSS
jgi:hypothetical protein